MPACDGGDEIDENTAQIPVASATETVSAPVIIRECLVGPYLQSATPKDIRIMWESPQPGESWVEWGQTPSLGNRTDSYEDIGSDDLSVLDEYKEFFTRKNPDSVIHHVHVTKLEPKTEYYYRVFTRDTVSSEIYSFTTPSGVGSENSITFVVYADTQRSGTQHSQVTDSIIEYLPEDPAMVWVVGDTVEDGPNYDGFKKEYFDPVAKLSCRIPYYTAVGNHEYLHYQDSPLIYSNQERNAEIYFAYADLPGDEHKYSFDYGNCHFIALDTSGQSQKCSFGEGVKAQLEWLEKDLITASADPNIDFIFAFHHHPYKSELMNQFYGGWTPCVGDFIKLYEKYGVNAFFHGHVHAMERGNSQEVPLYWIDSSGGGAPLANWLGAITSAEDSFDWLEIQKSVDEHGFHVIYVTAGDNSEFTVEYVSIGDLYNDPRDESEVIDKFTFKTENTRPEKPACLYPLSTDNLATGDIEFKATPFADPDAGDYHHETHWQITLISGNYPPLVEPAGLYPPLLSEVQPPLVADKWVRYENLYGETADGTPIDTRLGDDLTDETVNLNDGTTYYWRVRYRDGLGLAWSEWSDEASFTIEST